MSHTKEPVKSMRGANIKATLRHDAGAYARCSYCGRYSDNPNALAKDEWPCECGMLHGWSGSFVAPTADSLWSDLTLNGVGQTVMTVRRDDMQFCCGDDGRAYYVKDHIPLDEFMAAVRYEVGTDDPILKEEPVHCWMRVCRDFEQECSVLEEAVPSSRGAFRATWIQDA